MVSEPCGYLAGPWAAQTGETSPPKQNLTPARALLRQLLLILSITP
jgi:hypothetical protein